MTNVDVEAVELSRFRAEARSFLARHSVSGADEVAADDRRGDRALDRALAFQQELDAAGFAGLSVPTQSVPRGARWAKDALFTLSLSIAGGTNEIQRSIIAERVLGLPREPSTRCVSATQASASPVGPVGMPPPARQPTSRHE